MLGQPVTRPVQAGRVRLGQRSRAGLVPARAGSRARPVPPGTPLRCTPVYPPRRSSWTLYTRCGWRRTRSIRYGAGCSSTSSDIAAARRTRSTGSAGCCCAARRITPLLLPAAAHRTRRRRPRRGGGRRLHRPPRAAPPLRAPDLAEAKQRLHRFYWACALPGVPELERLGRTISAWQQQPLAYFTTVGVSNGPTEAVNLLVKSQAGRLQLPQLRGLPTSAPPALRRRLPHSPHDTDPRPVTAFHLVEPDQGERRVMSRGKRVTWRIFSAPVSRETKRSRPMAHPPCGGMPCSKAWR